MRSTWKRASTFFTKKKYFARFWMFGILFCCLSLFESSSGYHMLQRLPKCQHSIKYFLFQIAQNILKHFFTFLIFETSESRSVMSPRGNNKPVKRKMNNFLPKNKISLVMFLR